MHLHGEVLGRLVSAFCGGVLRVAAAEGRRELMAQVHHQGLETLRNTHAGWRADHVMLIAQRVLQVRAVLLT